MTEEFDEATGRWIGQIEWPQLVTRLRAGGTIEAVSRCPRCGRRNRINVVGVRKDTRPRCGACGFVEAPRLVSDPIIIRQSPLVKMHGKRPLQAAERRGLLFALRVNGATFRAIADLYGFGPTRASALFRMAEARMFHAADRALPRLLRRARAAREQRAIERMMAL